MKRLRSRLAERAGRLKSELIALHYAYRDPRTGILPKILILATLGYALSPVDLIPDFIPVIGYLDDLVIIPALISLSIKLIPYDVMRDARLRAENESFKLNKRWFFAVLIILIWTIVILVILRLILPLLRHHT